MQFHIEGRWGDILVGFTIGVFFKQVIVGYILKPAWYWLLVRINGWID